MPWLIGKIFKFLILLLILVAVVIAAMLLFIDPNDYKDDITNTLTAATGQSFTIQGDIQWSLGTVTSITISELNMNGNSSFKQVVFDFDLFSIFSNTIMVENLQVAEANIVVDWQAQPPMPLRVENQRVQIKQASIKDADITFVDSQKAINWQLKNASLTTENFSTNSGLNLAPIKLQGDLVDAIHNQAFNINTTMTIALDKNAINLDPLDITWHETTFHGTGSISQFQAPIITAKLSLPDTETNELLQKLNPYFDVKNSKSNHSMHAALEFSYYVADKILDLTKIDLGLDNGTLAGSFKVGFATPYQANFELNAQNIDFEPLILLARSTMPALQFNTVPTELLRNLVLSGKFVGKNLNFTDELTIDQLSLQVVAQDSKFQIAPISFSTYGSTNNLGLYIDVTGDLPFIRINEQAENVEISRWLHLFGAQRLAGTAAIKASIEGLGNDLPAILASLNGGVNFTVNNGTYYGFNLNNLADFEINLIREAFTKVASGHGDELQNFIMSESSKWIDGQKNNPYTKFTRLDLKAKFVTGISKDSSVIVETDAYTLHANGEINFVDDTINFTSTITSKNQPKIDIVKLARYLQQTPFTMTIVGTPSKPVFRPDIRSYASKSIESLLAAALQTATTRMVEVTPPNQKTTKTANQLFIDSLQALGHTGITQ